MGISLRRDFHGFHPELLQSISRDGTQALGPAGDTAGRDRYSHHLLVSLQSGQEWVAVAFFFFGRLLLGIFLISQFWLLANDIYDPRQAKRLFGFIGAGALLGGGSGAGLTVLFVDRLGTTNLLLVSTGILAVSFFLVLMIQRRTRPDATGSFKVKTDTVGGGEAMSMFRQSRHLQIIALIIGFGALGAFNDWSFFSILASSHPR